MENKQGHRRTPPAVWDRLKPLARGHRAAPTLAEDALWALLRNGGEAGFKFRRQHPIERFIVDFYCREAKLAIEVDGEHHQNQVEDDAVRDAYLRAQGIRTLRLSNAEVFGDSDAVRAKVLNALLPLSVHGEGAGG